MNPFDLFNRSEGESQRRRNDLKTAALQITALGGGGFAASKLLDGAKLKESLSDLKNDSTDGRELGLAGQKIREELNILQKNLADNTVERLKSSILDDDRIETILSNDTDPSTRRALLASLFDSYKMELGDGFDEGFGKKLEELYLTPGSISNEDKEKVKQFYKTNIASNDTASTRFNARYKRTLTVSDLLDGNLLDTTTGFKDNIKEIGNRSGYAQNAFKKIQSTLGGKGNVRLVERDLGRLGRSVEAELTFRGSKIPLYVPLKAGRTSFGTPVFAGTGSGATLYSGPMGMLDAAELRNAGFKKDARGAVPGFKTFESTIVDELLRGLRETGGNFNKHNINEFYSFMRSFGTDLPRSVIEGNMSVSDALLTSKSMEGSNIFIRNAKEAGMTSKQIVTQLISNMPDTFGGPPSSQTVTAQIVDPFDRNKTLSYDQVQLMKGLNGNKALNPLNQFLPFGRGTVDRALLPQTARESQMVGRYEHLSREATLTQDYKFGALNNINLFGTGRELMGMSPTEGATLKGANLAMFMVLGDKKSAQLGLSEGSAYSGGKFSVTTNLTKTVSQQGIEKFGLMSYLEKLEANKISELRVGSFATDEARGIYNIDDFFSKFGRGGEAILGYRDSSFSSIKRHKGLQEFSLKIAGRSMAGGTRAKVHLSGEAIKQLDNMKLFSGGFKGTLEYASKVDIEARLNDMAFGEQYKEFAKYAPHQASVFTDESMIKKSVHYLGMQMYGGFKYFGGDTDELLASMKTKIGADADYLAMINSLQSGGNAANIDSVAVKSRQGGFLRAMIESTLENKGSMTSQQMGMVLGGARHLGEKFGLTQTEIDDLIKSRGGDDVLAESKKGIAVGAMYATSGDVYSDLGRNLARVEPRFANYMYSSLRSNFGFSADDASNYLASIIARQEGAADKAQAALGMKLSSFSMSDLSAEGLERNLAGMTDIRTMESSKITSLIDVVGREREMGEILSESKSGNLLKTNRLGLSSKAQSALEKAIGGKKSIFLAGGETYEGLKGHIIRSQGEDINIANEYLRYTNDLVASIGNLRDAGDNEDKIRSSIKGFETSKKNLARVTSDTLRNVLSGKVLGSGTYRGKGISLGKGGAGNIGGKIMSVQQNNLMQKIFNKSAGYAIVADTQAFMDGMSAFKEAARRDMMRSSGKINVKKEVEDLMGMTLRNFFLGVHENVPIGVMVDSQRNPLIGMGNIFANIEMFSSGEDQEVFDQYLKGQVRKRYEKNDATKAAREQIFKEEKQKLQAEINQANLTRETESLKALSGEDKYQKALAYRRNELDDFLESRKVIDLEAKRLGFTGKDSRKNFFKFLNGFMGDEQLDELANRAGRDSDVGKAYLEVQKGGHQVLKTRYKDPSKNIGKAIKNYKFDKYKEYSDTMNELRTTQEYQSRKSSVSSVYNQINTNTNARMMSENIFETQGTVKGNKMFERLRSMEELFISTGEASDDFRSRAVGERFQSFEELFQAEQAVAKNLQETEVAEFNKTLGSTLRNMHSEFIAKGAQGGGTVSFFDVKIDSAQLLGKDGKVVGNFSGRADINRAGIGDFDGDIYQVFFRTDEASVRGTRLKVSAPKQMFGQAMSMSIMLDQLTQGMGHLGKRMGAGDMNLIASQISEKEKERILKGVGGVDIEVKTLMMGMAQAASDAGDQGEYFKSMKAGMAVISAMQEQLVIQAKKLPMASNVPEAFTKALRTGFRTGSGEELKRFLTENVLRDTDLMKNRRISVGDVSFANIDANSLGGKAFKEGIQDVALDIDEIFATLDRGFAAVKSYGLDKMPSTNRLMKQLSEGRVADMQMLSNLLSSSMTMEGGVVGGNSVHAMSEIERIMSNADKAIGRMSSSFAQRAGALGIAGGLIASGAIGTMMSPGELNPEGVFSDMRVRENMSMRNLQENMGREHGNVSPQMVGGPQDNFYERPILSGETAVISNTSTRFYGEAPSMSNGVSMARQFVSAGGQAAMHINDTRLPISNSYITKSIRD